MACDECNLTHAMASRMDAWRMADTALKKAKWPDDYKVDPQDVLALAMFLMGAAES